MSFVSFRFLLFFPLVTFLYFVIPQKFRWIWLLAASYYFFMSWDAYAVLFLFLSTVITWLGGILIAKAGKRSDGRADFLKKAVLAVSLAANIGILCTFKYLDFFGELGSWLCAAFGVQAAAPRFGLAAPVGISFYTFRVLSYSMDVYRGDAPPERNLGKYALFVSFFPQLVAGPIEKAKNFLPQFAEAHSFDLERAKRGLLKMFWGYFEKMVVADRLGKLVDTVYAAPQSHYGLEVAVGTVFFAFQLYCDFDGYSNIALGACEILGFRGSENFKRPYFSKSIKEFWKRWHITLGSWFWDYLYLPLGGNRCSKLRHGLNLMAVFIVCGLWHGAALSFVAWGALHGLYQVVGLLLRPGKNRLEKRLNIRQNALWFKAVRAGCTFVLVDFAWIFFRADGFRQAVLLIRNLFRFDPAAFWNGTLFGLGLSAPEFWAGVVGIAVVAAVGFLGRGRDLRESFLSRGRLFRWTVCTASVLAIVIFGVYGPISGSGQFIYSQF